MAEQGDCFECRYWEQVEDSQSSLGECKRYPPVIIASLLSSEPDPDYSHRYLAGWYSVTHRNNTCGEWCPSDETALQQQRSSFGGPKEVVKIELSLLCELIDRSLLSPEEKQHLIDLAKRQTGHKR